MKRLVCLIAAMLLLCGCAAGETDAVQISIVEGAGYTVLNNGQWVRPGADAVFLLEMEPGSTVADTDHPGGTVVRIREGLLELTVKNVRYPARIRPELTRNYATITYCANGAAGAETTLVYDLTHHIRPNTATDLFARDGYTLESWNTAPDGTGVRIGLGSRVTADREGLTLYAQWAAWSDPADFSYTAGHDITITGYHGSGDAIVIPAVIDGKEVAAIGYHAFRNCRAERLILPSTVRRVANGAFESCAFESVTIFDTVENISDDSFRDCPDLRTVHINAAEAPFGYGWRKESCYADKIDLLIAASGRKKLVCFGGCAMWYNLDGAQMAQAFSDHCTVINLGLNGLVNSAIQMQIMGAFLEKGDVLFHTPELSSRTQMMLEIGMDQDDDKLWCGLENNYDLVSLVEFGSVPGLLDSFSAYLAKKEEASDYAAVYTDSLGRCYMDRWGGIPFVRDETMDMLSDSVSLDPACVDTQAMARLRAYYEDFCSRGVTVCVGYACVNLDALPLEQRENGAQVDRVFRDAICAMDGPVMISDLSDYLYRNDDFYDTNYHLRSDAAARNTALWIRDLREFLEGGLTP